MPDVAFIDRSSAKKPALNQFNIFTSLHIYVHVITVRFSINRNLSCEHNDFEHLGSGKFNLLIE